MNYSQRMAGNNDLMDPDWKPSPHTEEPNKLVDLMRDIQEHFKKYEELMSRHKDINWETHQISIHVTKYNKDKILSIIERLK